MNKYLIGIAIAVAVFLAGLYTGKGQTQVQVQEKIVEKAGETTTVYRDRIVTVTKVQKPDGTIEETTRTEEKEGRKEEKLVVREKDKSTVTTPNLSKYSLGLKYWAPISDILDVGRVKDSKNYEITAGYRVLGEVWLQTGYKLDKQVSLGIAVQF
jgi:hypothetical protein